MKKYANTNKWVAYKSSGSIKPQIAGFDCPCCEKPLDINGLLSKYGPEGLYELADLLKSAADEDISDSFKQ